MEEIRSMESLAALVESLGFLPLLKNRVPGFSVEEHTPLELWFADGVDGPWEWKGPVIQKTGCAYGKFFGGKAGFISKEWYPDFANYRRVGYDFDARYDDGLARSVDNRVYDALLEHQPLLSKEWRRLTGIGKRGEFDAIVTRLQMQGYVVTTNFEYATDKTGNPYGWGLARYATPEAAFGEAFTQKKANFLAAQDKEFVPEQEAVTVFTPTEIAKFKQEAFSTFANGKRKYQQAAAYILMLNTGLRTGELLGLLNSDIDLERRILHLERGVKEVWRRDGLQAEPGRDVKVGKLKSATSKRTVPLNDTAIAMIKDLRKEVYFGENVPLVPDEHGNYTRPVNFRKRYYRILAAAGIKKKGLHSLRHTFASSLVNGIKQEDGTIKSLTPRQVADLLGHSTSQITELYYVKKDTSRLHGITDGFNL